MVTTREREGYAALVLIAYLRDRCTYPLDSLLPDDVSSANARRDNPRLLWLALLAVVLHSEAAVRGGGYRAHPPQIPVVNLLRRHFWGVAALKHVYLF